MTDKSDLSIRNNMVANHKITNIYSKILTFKNVSTKNSIIKFMYH